MQMGEPARRAVLVFVDEGPAGTPSPSVLSALARYWALIGACAAIAGLGAVIYCLVAPKWYRAQTTIAPVHFEADRGSLGGLGAQLGGLASLVGLDAGSEEDEKKETLARFTSREFVYNFLRSQGVVPILFANKWDAVEHRWRSPGRAPTLEQAYRYFMGRVCTISEDRRTNLVKVTVDWKDPALASAWANELVAAINADRRIVARSEAERNLEFLNRELGRTNVVELRQSINHLIEGEIRKSMLVNVREQYAFNVIDPAFQPGIEAVVWPRIAISTIGAVLLGGLLGVGIALVRQRRS
jgi:hypothetical protein